MPMIYLRDAYNPYHGARNYVLFARVLNCTAMFHSLPCNQFGYVTSEKRLTLDKTKYIEISILITVYHILVSHLVHHMSSIERPTNSIE